MMRLSCLLILLGVFTFASPDLIAADTIDHGALADEKVPGSVVPDSLLSQAQAQTETNSMEPTAEDMQLLTAEQRKVYERDRTQIQMHEQTLLALHVSTKSTAKWNMPCGHDWWNIWCWEGAVKHAFEQIHNFSEEIKEKANQIVELGKQLAEIKPIMEQLGECLTTLPGAMPLDQALIQLKNAVEGNNLIGWLDETYVHPFITRTQSNWNGTIGILTAFTDNQVEIFQNGEMNAAAIGSLPKKLLQMTFDIIRLDVTGKCLMDSTIMQDFMKLADVPIFTQMFTEIVKALSELWKHIQPVFDHVINFISEKVKPLITDMLAPMVNQLDHVVSDTINAIFKDASHELLSFVRNETGKMDRDLLCTMNDVGSSLITKPKQTLKKIFTQVLTFASKQVTKLLDEQLYQPMINQIIWLITQAQGGLMQILVGLCGLIPEVGGVICAAITKPISDLASWAIAELTSKSVKGLVSVLQDWIVSEIPTWADAIASPLADLITQGKDIVGTAIPVPKHPQDVVGKEAAAFGKGMAPIMQAVEPFLIEAAKAVFPKVSLDVQKAQNYIHTLTSVVKYNLCIDKNAPPPVDPSKQYPYPPFGPLHPPGF